MFSKSKIILSFVVLGTFLEMAETPAYASLVTYSTTGSFNGGALATITFGGGGNTLTLTFDGINPATTVDTGPSFTFSSLGHIITSATGTGATITNPTTLAINIAQLLPPGSASVGVTLDGTVSQNLSTATLTFSPNNVMISGISYSIANNPLALLPPNTLNGDTSILVKISANQVQVPEPMTSTLIGFGLISLVSLRRLWRCIQK